MADKDGSDQTFTFGTVVILVASILEKEGSLGMNDYKRMSVLDGTRGASSFDHMFRKVKARAKALNEQAKAEGGMTPVKKTKATGGSSKKRIESTSGKKRGACDHSA